MRELVQVGEVKLRMSVLDGDGDDEEHHVIIIYKRRIVFASVVDGFVSEAPLELVLGDGVSSQRAFEGLIFNVPAHCPSLKDAEPEYFGVSQDCQVDVILLCVQPDIISVHSLLINLVPGYPDQSVDFHILSAHSAFDQVLFAHLQIHAVFVEATLGFA